MSSISELSDECQKCHYKDICDNKRMMACALAEVEKHEAIPNRAVGVINPFSTTVIPTTFNITNENIKEQLEKQLRINTCSFNK